MKCLNIGAGHRPIIGYVNVDIQALPGIDVVADIRHLPFGDNEFDYILCNHVLEHLIEDDWQEYHEISQAISEIARVLKPDGVAVITVPSPNSDDAVRRDHKTVYGYARLREIFGHSFSRMNITGRDTWLKAHIIRRIFSQLARYDPFWGNTYEFRLTRPIKAR